METDPKTKRTSWQATKAAETRQRILDAALEVIAEKGVASLTLDAVVQQSGVTKGGLQYHFASKEALAFGVLQHSATTFLEDVGRACQGPAEDDGVWSRSLIAFAFREETADIGSWKPLIEMLGYAGEVKTLSETFYREINRRLQGAGLSPTVALVLMMSLEGYSTSPVDLPPNTGKVLRDYFLGLLETAHKSEK